MNPVRLRLDFPDRSKLMAANNTVYEFRKYLTCRLAPLSELRRRACSSHRPAGIGLLHGPVTRKLSGSLRSFAGQHIIERRRKLTQTLGERRRKTAKSHAAEMTEEG